MLTTLAIGSVLFMSLFPEAQGKPSSRPTRPLSDAERYVDQDFGPNPPGHDVLRGKKFLPMRDARYGSADDVKDRVRDEDLVIGLVVGGQAFAYPINMLGGPQREIVNEEWGGIAFCVNW